MKIFYAVLAMGVLTFCACAKDPKSDKTILLKPGETRTIPLMDWLHLENSALRATELENGEAVAAWKDALKKRNELYQKVCNDAGIVDMSRCLISRPDSKSTKTDESATITLKPEDPKPGIPPASVPGKK